MFDSLKSLGQLGPLMAKAREMQTKMAEVQQKLGDIKTESSAAGGIITVTANGRMEIIELQFSPDAVRLEAPVLADLTRSAVNDALVNVRNRVQQEMQGVAGDMDLSGIQKMMGMPS